MLNNFYAKIIRLSNMRYRGQVFYNGVDEPLFTCFCAKMTKKEAEKCLFEDFRDYASRHKEELADKIVRLYNSKKENENA